MSSLFKKAHKTHALAQPAGIPYPRPRGEVWARGEDAPDPAAEMFAELCSLVPDAATRVAMLAASIELDAAWRRGERLPVLRAHRKNVERALRIASSL